MTNNELLGIAVEAREAANNTYVAVYDFIYVSNFKCASQEKRLEYAYELAIIASKTCKDLEEMLKRKNREFKEAKKLYEYCTSDEAEEQ